MPVIKPYNVQTSAVGAPEVQQARGAGIVGDSIANLGQAISGVADVMQKRKEQEDVSNLHVEISKTQSEFTNKYRQELQQGTLDVEKFNQDVQTHFDKLAEGVETRSGRMYFQQAAAELKGHFLEQSAIGSAELAGERAKSNFMQSLNNSSSALLNEPSSFEITNKLQLQGIDNLVKTGGLPAQAAEKLRLESQNQLAKASIRGWIKLNPDIAREQLDKGKWDSHINGEVKDQLYGEIDTQIRANSVQEERMKKQKEEARQQAQLETQNDFLKRMQTGSLSPNDVLNSDLDAFGSGSKEAFIRMIEVKNKETNEKKITTDSSVFINLWDRTHLPDGDPNKITNENDLNKYFGRGLTVDNINTLRAEIQGKKTIEGGAEAELKKGLMDLAKGKLTRSNPLTGIRDPIGDENYQRYLNSFLKDYAKKRQEGMSPEQLLNPDSKDYLGKNINQYIRSQRDVMRDMVRSQARTAVPIPQQDLNNPVQAAAAETLTTKKLPLPRQPNESAQDYLKRIGK